MIQEWKWELSRITMVGDECLFCRMTYLNKTLFKSCHFSAIIRSSVLLKFRFKWGIRKMHIKQCDLHVILNVASPDCGLFEGHNLPRRWKELLMKNKIDSSNFLYIYMSLLHVVYFLCLML